MQLRHIIYHIKSDPSTQVLRHSGVLHTGTKNIDMDLRSGCGLSTPCQHSMPDLEQFLKLCTKMVYREALRFALDLDLKPCVKHPSEYKIYNLSRPLKIANFLLFSVSYQSLYAVT